MFPFRVDMCPTGIDIYGRPDLLKLTCVSANVTDERIGFMFRSGGFPPISLYAERESALKVLQHFIDKTCPQPKQDAAAKLASVATVDLIRELYRRSAAGDIDAHPADTKPE